MSESELRCLRSSGCVPIVTAACEWRADDAELFAAWEPCLQRTRFSLVATETNGADSPRSSWSRKAAYPTGFRATAGTAAEGDYHPPRWRRADGDVARQTGAINPRLLDTLGATGGESLADMAATTTTTSPVHCRLPAPRTCSAGIRRSVRRAAASPRAGRHTG
jgi:hypothetical protein